MKKLERKINNLDESCITDLKKFIWLYMGKKMKEQRKKTKLSLRKFSENYSVNWSDLSKMERGLKNPVKTYNEIFKG